MLVHCMKDAVKKRAWPEARWLESWRSRPLRGRNAKSTLVPHRMRRPKSLQHIGEKAHGQNAWRRTHAISLSHASAELLDTTLATRAKSEFDCCVRFEPTSIRLRFVLERRETYSSEMTRITFHTPVEFSIHSTARQVLCIGPLRSNAGASSAAAIATISALPLATLRCGMMSRWRPE